MSEGLSSGHSSAAWHLGAFDFPGLCVLTYKSTGSEGRVSHLLGPKLPWFWEGWHRCVGTAAGSPPSLLARSVFVSGFVSSVPPGEAQATHGHTCRWRS